MAVRFSWQYDFTIPGHGRERQGRYKTKAEASLAEKVARERIISGNGQITLTKALDGYLAAMSMKARSRGEIDRIRPLIEEQIRHLFIEAVDTSSLDLLKQKLPGHLGPKSKTGIGE